MDNSTRTSFSALFGAADLEELVAMMEHLENGTRGWLLLHPLGPRPARVLAGRDQRTLDKATALEIAKIQCSGVDKSTGRGEPWARDLLNLLSGQFEEARKTNLVVPIWAGGCLLAYAGFSVDTRTVSTTARFAALCIVMAVRRQHEIDELRQDVAGHKLVQLHWAKPFVLVTATGRIMGGTEGGLAILSELHPKNSNGEIASALPLVLRRAINADDQQIVVSGYQARIKHPPLFRIVTTAEKLIQITFFRVWKGPARQPVVANLTPTEQKVHVFLMQGDRNKEIASKLNISEHTVRHHVSAVLRKFSCSDRLLLIARATAGIRCEKNNS